jgi:hypothetical protein
MEDSRFGYKQKFLKKNSEPHRGSWEFYATEGKSMQP